MFRWIHTWSVDVSPNRPWLPPRHLFWGISLARRGKRIPHAKWKFHPVIRTTALRKFIQLYYEYCTSVYNRTDGIITWFIFRSIPSIPRGGRNGHAKPRCSTTRNKEGMRRGEDGRRGCAEGRTPWDRFAPGSMIRGCRILCPLRMYVWWYPYVSWICTNIWCEDPSTLLFSAYYLGAVFLIPFHVSFHVLATQRQQQTAITTETTAPTTAADQPQRLP